MCYIAIFYIHAPSQPYSKDVLTRMTNSKTSFQYFTYFEEQESCLAFANCEDFSEGTCVGQEACFSGSRDCGGEIPTSYSIIANASMGRNMACLQKHFSCCFVKCEASFQSENGQFRALLLWKMILAIVKTTTARRETCFYRQIEHIFWAQWAFPFSSTFFPLDLVCWELGGCDGTIIDEVRLGRDTECQVSKGGNGTALLYNRCIIYQTSVTYNHRRCKGLILLRFTVDMKQKYIPMFFFLTGILPREWRLLVVHICRGGQHVSNSAGKRIARQRIGKVAWGLTRLCRHTWQDCPVYLPEEEGCTSCISGQRQCTPRRGVNISYA